MGEFGSNMDELVDPPPYSHDDSMFMSVKAQSQVQRTNYSWSCKVSSGSLRMDVFWSRGEAIIAKVDIFGSSAQQLVFKNVSVSENSFGLIVPFQPQVISNSHNHVSFETAISFQQCFMAKSPTLIYPKYLR
ncbi:uncharacterized protein LOC115231838 [Octopus sinensis]|uniref:Uncharacterized protein LOC115231838 n=1 Tax=Octopus sinensis TaxID=2607531 RepID=A0A6P7U5M4_9MOLL|nr:uncharacterized protein LOC115231838 [Octopus sinensis]